MPSTQPHPDTTTSLLGVAGLPQVVAASLSPTMFAAAFAELGMRAWYVPLAIRERSVRKALRSLPRLGFRGVNVTMPYKAVAAEIAHSRSDTVERTGVANTLLIDESGHIHAEATDGVAVVGAVGDAGVDLAGATVTVIGAGGAATEAAFACAGAGAGRLLLWNRHPARAARLASRLQKVFPALGVEVQEALPIHVPAHVLVSAVPRDSIPAASLGHLHAGMVVVDLAYRSDRHPTALVEAARNHAAACIDGREILVRQGAASFRHWFGVDAPVEVMMRAVT